MTRRQEQLNSQILEILSTVIQAEMQDPRLQLLTVTRVQVNRDASHAMVYFTSSDDEHEREEIIQALSNAKGFLRSVLAEMMDLRYTPDLTFRYDDAAEQTRRVLDLFDQIAEEREKNPPHFDEDADE